MPVFPVFAVCLSAQRPLLVSKEGPAEKNSNMVLTTSVEPSAPQAGLPGPAPSPLELRTATLITRLAVFYLIKNLTFPK